jgi:hypothetical protein
VPYCKIVSLDSTGNYLTESKRWNRYSSKDLEFTDTICITNIYLDLLLESGALISKVSHLGYFVDLNFKVF